MKEGNIVDDSELTACSALTEMGRNTMSELDKTKASSCFIYDVDFGNVVKEHRVTHEEDFRGKKDNALADVSSSVRRDLKYHHTAYEVFGSSNMKDIAKVLGDVIELGTGSVFHFLYNLPSSTRLLYSRKGRARQ